MMNRYFQLSLLLIVMATLPEDSQSACCYPSKATLKCFDGTFGTPYCGYKKCNWFGCNCGGGCRGSRDKSDLNLNYSDETIPHTIMNGKISHFLFIKTLLKVM